MHDIERRVGRETRAMTRRAVITKAITKQLRWVQASEILGISVRRMRRLRRKLERRGISAVMDQRGDRPQRKRIKAGTIELLSGSSATSTPISLCGTFTSTSPRSTA